MTPHSCEHPFEENRLNGTADFRVEWDVASLGRAATDALRKEIEAIRKRPAPDPARKLHLVCGPAGYGKTHLFGRVRSEQAERVQFVFIPAPPDPARATSYVSWRVVETLFDGDGSPYPPICRRLAELFRPSFAAYFDQLPGAIRARCAGERKALADDPLTVLQFAGHVTELSPFHALADSVHARFPDLPRSVLRAMVLSLSAAAVDARTWLRGEADQLTPERLAELRLDPASPNPADVLKAVGTLLARVRVPLVLCLDQFDLLYLGSAAGFQELTAHLMGWLQTVPGLSVVIGCVEANWREIAGSQALTAFVQRVIEHKLEPLTPAQARELIVRRMRTWENFDVARGDGWPFDLSSVEAFADLQPTPPRGFLDRCRLQFDEWLAGGRSQPIRLVAARDSRTQLPELFVQEWNGRLEAARRELKSPGDYQDAELWAGLEESLRVAQSGQYVPAGTRFAHYQTQALQPTKTDSRPSAELRLEAGEGSASLVVAVNKKDSGAAFSAWFKALTASMNGTVRGAVVVWPRASLGVQKTAQSYRDYQQKVQERTIRPFPLDENEPVFAQMECLRKLMTDAAAGMVVVGEKTLSAEDCRGLLVETRLLAEFPLFTTLFHDWPALRTAVSAPAPASSAAAVAAGQMSAHTTGALSAQPRAEEIGRSAHRPSERSEPAEFEGRMDGVDHGHPWSREMLGRVAEKLRSKGQPVKPVGAEVGPTFVRLKLEPTDDVDFAKVKKQADNLKLHLGLESKPVIGNQAGYISVDVVRPDRQRVSLAPLLVERPAALSSAPAFPVGVDVAGKAHWLNFAEPAHCHLLVAGTTGSGKSQLLKSMIAALCDHHGPDQIQFLLIDPKQVTFTLPGSSPYLLQPVVFDATAAVPLMTECCEEMERRYALFRDLGREHIGELTGRDAVPRWIVVIDEFADLMLGDRQARKSLDTMFKRLGAKARAAGIHLVLGTQRPEASVVTPLLRSNLPGRISLQVATERESKLILDEPHAAHLLDKGDLLWRRGGSLLRLQSPLVSREELEQALRLH